MEDKALRSVIEAANGYRSGYTTTTTTDTDDAIAYAFDSSASKIEEWHEHAS